MKRAQVNAFMSVLVVVFFMLFAMIGFILYGASQIRESEVDVRLASEVRAQQVTNIILAMPELRCSVNNEWERYCIDKTKVPVFRDSNQEYFRDILGFSFVFIALPSDPSDPLFISQAEALAQFNEQFIFGNALAEDSITAVETTQTPITLFDPFTNTYDYGLLLVEVTS